MANLNTSGGSVDGGCTQGTKPQLPPFCYIRRPTTSVYVSSLQILYLLLLLILGFQLSTILLLIAAMSS